MKIIEWNIRHGACKTRLLRILDSIRNYSADIVIVVEYRFRAQDALEQKFADIGYEHITTSDPQKGINGILIASRRPFVVVPDSCEYNDAQHRWLEVEIQEPRFHLLSVHVPNANDKQLSKQVFWKAILRRSKEIQVNPALIIGDFNTGLPIDTEGIPFKHSEYMHDLINSGWTDLWRDAHPITQEYSWYSNAHNGFRLDYAYASAKLKPIVTDIHFSHSERELTCPIFLYQS